MEYAIFELYNNRSHISNDGNGDRKFSNVMILLCYLYNFGIIHSMLMYDLLQDFIESFEVWKLELIVLCLTHSGHTLRSDNINNFKSISLNVQKRALSLSNNRDDNEKITARL